MTKVERMIHASDRRIDAIVAELDRHDGGRFEDGYADWDRVPGLRSFFSNAMIRRAKLVAERDAATDAETRAKFRSYRSNMAWGEVRTRPTECPYCGEPITSKQAA